MPWQRLDLNEIKWLGQLVHSFDGSLIDLEATLPTFSKKPFTYGPALNEYHDLIVRNPIPNDEREVPVATVSKQYALIQHREAVRWTVEAFQQLKWNPAKLRARTLISDYGERMRVTMQIPVEPVDPGDGYDLQPEILLWNSVDRSRAFELAVRWQRLVCSNGLAIWTEDRLRKIHNVATMASESPIEFLTLRLPASRDRMAKLGQWLNVSIGQDKLIRWANHQVAEKWGITRAARLIHILQNGHDCAVGKRINNQPASEVKVVPGNAVPGAQAPVRNAYHAYQALLWIANAEPSLDKQDELLAGALELMRLVLPSRLH
jgi:hypothetical protein